MADSAEIEGENTMGSKKQIQRLDSVESVGIVVKMKDGRSKTYPLEIWQVGVLTEILGFQVKVPDLDDYRMSDEKVVSAKMDVFRKAAEKLPMESWTEYWDLVSEKEK